MARFNRKLSLNFVIRQLTIAPFVGLTTKCALSPLRRQLVVFNPPVTCRNG
jgi:hypothetical protein